MEVSKIPSIQNHTAPEQRPNNTTKEQTPQEKQANQKDQQVEDAVRQLNLMADPSQVYLQFKLNEKSGDYYVQMIDSKTNEVIKEIPSKKILDYFAEMKKFQGLLYDKKI